MMASPVLSSLLLAIALLSPAFAGTVPQGTIAVPLIRDDQLTYYLAEFQVGTPPQKEFLAMDTGSTTYSFIDPRNPWCQDNTNPCSKFGTFDNTTSSTSIYEGPSFNDLLGDQGNGDYLNDTVIVGNASIPYAYFGYVSSFNTAHVNNPTTTIAALALTCFETGPNCDWAGPYLLPQLKNASVIDQIAVSLYLGPDTVNDTGSEMLLGGTYDKAKMDGEPLTLQMVDPFNNSLIGHRTNWVNVTALSAVVENDVTSATFGDAGVGINTLLDTGTPTWYLPYTIFDPVYTAIGSPSKAVGASARSGSHYDVSCQYRSLNASSNYIGVSFAGSQSQLKVPISSLITDFGDGTCGTSIGNASAPQTFGTPFLRSTYAVFDAENFEVTLAEVRYTTETEYVELPKGGFGK